LERQLECIETEKQGLSTSVREVQESLETARREVAAQKVTPNFSLVLPRPGWPP
jgi:hypothetical protein